MTKKSRIEIDIDGVGSRSHVYLIVVSDAGELKYELPGVTSVDVRVDARGGAEAQIVFGGVRARASLEIGPGKASINDVLTEIAAHRLAADRGDGESYMHSRVLVHGPQCNALRTTKASDCDCFAEDRPNLGRDLEDI